MTKGLTFNKYRNIEHGRFPIPKWLCEKDAHGIWQEYLNGVYLDHLEKVADEEEVYECHLYDLWMEKLEKLLEGCKQKGIRMTIKPLSQYNPNHTIAIRFEKMDWSKKKFMDSIT